MSGAGEDNELPAAEFVLGTLDFSERAALASRRERDPALAAAIEAWERRLGPLAETVPSRGPPPDLFDRIMAKISDTPVTGAAQAAAPAQGNVIDITRRLRRWRAGALTATALAASLAIGVGLLGWRDYIRQEAPKSFVAVLQKDGASPAFLVSVDIDSRAITVRPVSAPEQPGKSYELWIANARLGTPKSLGVIGEETFTRRASLGAYDRETIEESDYVVTLEEEGGSKNGLPQGPAVFRGKLIQATP